MYFRTTKILSHPRLLLVSVGVKMPKSKVPHMARTSFVSLKNKFPLLFFLLFAIAVLGTLKLWFNLNIGNDCPKTIIGTCRTIEIPGPPAPPGNVEEVDEFWRQPDDMGYRPCLKFSGSYVKETKAIVGDRSRYLMVVVTGGLNQQRSETIDAVVIARILGAALVVPVFHLNTIWKDESEFSDIFDLDHFKRVLADDVRVVSSLPPTHLTLRPAEFSTPPFGVTVHMIRSRYQELINKERVLALYGIHSRLSKELPGDLQRLRCKVAFHALKFKPKILELGNTLAARMRNDSRYLALHLRVEKDVWVRSGCSPGLTPEHDAIVDEERRRHPKLLTEKVKLSYRKRKLAGLCPLTVTEVTRMLKALGCPRDARIYWAGGEPFGGREIALAPLLREFPFLYTKENISLPGELEQFADRASVLAAIDYIVAESSDVYVQSHGGNMDRYIQGDRAYKGHKKHIIPNKQEMLPYFLNTSLSEAELRMIVEELHTEYSGQPHFKLPGKDVTAHPIPACMCNTSALAM